MVPVPKKSDKKEKNSKKLDLKNMDSAKNTALTMLKKKSQE